MRDLASAADPQSAEDRNGGEAAYWARGTNNGGRPMSWPRITTPVTRSVCSPRPLLTADRRRNRRPHIRPLTGLKPIRAARGGQPTVGRGSQLVRRCPQCIHGSFSGNPRTSLKDRNKLSYRLIWLLETGRPTFGSAEDRNGWCLLTLSSASRMTTGRRDSRGSQHLRPLRQDVHGWSASSHFGLTRGSQPNAPSAGRRRNHRLAADLRVGRESQLDRRELDCNR
jgi:hypothetical protein